VPIAYTRAPTVSVGQAITSVDYNKLADAFNDRLKHGVADPTWRLFWYSHALIRNLRNPDAGFNLWPAEDEFWKFYGHIKHDAGLNWPVAAAGTSEGVNVSQPLGAFIFGQEPSLYDEPGRMNYDGSEGTGIDLDPIPSTPLDFWELGKTQRGVTNATGSDLTNANALVAAQSHGPIQYGRNQYYLKGYGGFFSTANNDGFCADGVHLEVDPIFTNIAEDKACNYLTCPESSQSSDADCPGLAKPIRGWSQGFTSYLLYHWDGSITHLPFDEFFEGPYSDNAQLGRRHSEQLQQTLNKFVSGFRGSDAQREAIDYNVFGTGFDFQKFLETQYYLAPAYGTATGSGGSLEAVYPQFDFPAGSPAGTFGVYNASTTYAIHSGFVLSKVIAVGDPITSEKNFEVYLDDQLLTTLTITPSSDEAMFCFPNPARGTVKIKCLEEIAASGEDVFVEIAEILEYKPDVNDAYALLRMASTNGASGAEGLGNDETDPVNISDDYFSYGMAHNPTHTEIPAQSHMNKNPIWETARRMINDRQRMAERTLLNGYEVSGGKSILYFSRNPRGVSSLDVFEGIAPSTEAIASGSIRAGVKYKVELAGGGDVTYDGTTYSTDGETFTGVYGVPTYTKTGSPTVREYEIIISEAPEAGETNEWLMFMNTTIYEDRESSIYKPEAFGDVLGFLGDRCTFQSKCWNQLDTKFTRIREHVAYGARPVIRTENPSGYRYLENSDGSCDWEEGGNSLISADNGLCDKTSDDCEGSIKHYTSCQIYKPDYQIESVTLDDSGNVKVQLTGRLQTELTGDIANTPAARTTAIDSLDIRTDEAAILEYLKYGDDGTDCVVRPGDVAPDADTGSGFWLGDFNGSCFPRFYFTKLIPKVYEDGNSTVQDTDTRATVDHFQWMEYVLRAICEGYVDSKSTIEQLCEQCDGDFPDPCTTARKLYDYKWEDLNDQAMGRRWQYFLPLKVRDDGQRGHGPLPNTIMYADHFNQLAKSVNLLTRARIDLPVAFSRRSVTYTGTGAATLDNSEGNSDSDQFQDSVTAPGVTSGASFGAWTTDISAEAEWRVTFQDDGAGTTELIATRTDQEYKATLGELRQHALPDDLATLLNTNNQFGFLAAKQTGRQETERQSATGPTDEPPCTGKPFEDPSSTYHKFVEVGTDDDHECLLITAGTLITDPPPVNDLYWYTDGSCTGVNFSKTVLVPQQGAGFVEVPLV
jgi:hypothetical protein